MHCPSILVAVALVANTLAAPALNAQPHGDITANNAPLEVRADTVACRPPINKSSLKTFNVDIAYAKSQANKAAFKRGKSGYPHQYHNEDNIKWNVKECDVKDAPLWEYPVFWVGSKGKNGQKEWKIDIKKDKQEDNKTPLRVVYVNQRGGAKFCGVMTHKEVTNKYQGLQLFAKCT